ncbi:hypothetical protein CLOM_g6400 [Closterium sp. NIES-68]|nr:hypothetical protein CLOM_g6400 [Closterium sp. NIES-68]GJP68555.1 hypothetical protein CLOP_g25240 [Closterium sp. NIES-67]
MRHPLQPSVPPVSSQSDIGLNPRSAHGSPQRRQLICFARHLAVSAYALLVPLISSHFLFSPPLSSRVSTPSPPPFPARPFRNPFPQRLRPPLSRQSIRAPSATTLSSAPLLFPAPRLPPFVPRRLTGTGIKRRKIFARAIG